jgi:hypothetical protein
MGIPKKRKNNIQIYKESEGVARRQELLDKITKSDTYLPDSILHDDLDRGMLDYIKNTFKVVSDGTQIPIIDKILTIQRWGEFTQNWSFSDEDNNLKLPFIATIRKPDVQFGTNPSVQRTIPDRYQIYYAAVPNWNGTTMGADIYTIPQPIPVDVTFDVSIVCGKFRDLNKFNKIVLKHFASRQDYTTIKGHYIPIVLDNIEDNSPIETIDGRRFYIQNYKFTMLGYLIDSEEFEVKPAINRLFTMYEFVNQNAISKKFISKTVNIVTANQMAIGGQTLFNVGEPIGTLFTVAINGIIQIKDVHYYHIAYTSRITFEEAIPDFSIVTIIYYKGKNSIILDNFGKLLKVKTEIFTYSSGVNFFLDYDIKSIVTLDVNGLVQTEGSSFEITGEKDITLLGTPSVGSKIGITYVY